MDGYGDQFEVMPSDRMAASRHRKGSCIGDHLVHSTKHKAGDAYGGTIPSNEEE